MRIDITYIRRLKFARRSNNSLIIALMIFIPGQFSKGGYRIHIRTFSLKNKKISFSLISNFVFTESFSSYETRNDAFYYKNVV